MDAVVSGKGWDALPPELRRQADTPWFKSWLLFDPAVALNRVNQPLLIMHGALDTQIPPSHADRLEELARARKRVPPEATRKIILPKINHLLLPAVTGEVDEYESLAVRTIATGRDLAGDRVVEGGTRQSRLTVPPAALK